MPSVHLGPAARRNANGYEIVHRDQPMEEMTRLQSWKRTEWRGRDKIEVEDVIQSKYRRYPRTYVPGEGVQFVERLVRDEMPERGPVGGPAGWIDQDGQGQDRVSAVLAVRSTSEP